MPNSRILELFNQRNSSYYTAYYQNFKKFKQQQLRTVNYMVKEFEMKKSADAYRRTKTSRTGMLNMNKLHTYKYNEDIFKRIEVTPGAKNHGMILVVDWSGSMDTAMHDTLVQTMNLVMFCKAVQIPCKVFAFTDIGRQHFYDRDDGDYIFGIGRYSNTPYEYTKENELVLENVTMMELVDTTSKTPVYNKAMTYLHQMTKYFHGRRNRYGYNVVSDNYEEEDSYFTVPQCMRLGGTPLDSAILHTIDIVNTFQKKHKVQKMTTIFLTDGVGHASGQITKVANTDYEKDPNMSNFMSDHPDNCNIVIQEKQYQFGYNQNIRGYQFMRCHKPMFDYFKHKTGSQLVGFFITSGKNLTYNELSNFSKDPYQSSYEETMQARKELKEKGVITKTNIGYDELFILPKSKLQVKDEEVNITTDMSASKMKQQFLKNFKTKRVSRVLLNKFVERVA